jgi:hypothetical protein
MCAVQDMGMGGQVYDRSSIEKMVGKGDAMFSGQGALNHTQLV